MRDYVVTLKVEDVEVATGSFRAESEDDVTRQANALWDRELAEAGVGKYTLSIRRLRPPL
jgi:hypothetical protein